MVAEMLDADSTGKAALISPADPPQRSGNSLLRNRRLGLGLVAMQFGGLVFLTAALIQTCNLASAQEEILFNLYTEAQAAQKAGDLRTAANHYEEIVRLRPDLAEAHANLGSIYYQIRDDEQAAASLERAIDLNPQLTAPHFFLGVVGLRQHDYPKAIRHLEASARLGPSDAAVPLYLGEAYFSVGRYSAAAAQFWNATRHEGFRADAYYALNRVCGELAEQALDQLAIEHPGSFYVHLALGHFHEGRKNWKDAENAYREALKRKPGAVGLEARLRWVSRSAAGGGPAGARPLLSATAPTMLGLLYDPPSDLEIDLLLGKYRGRLLGSRPDREGQESLYKQAEDFQIAAYLAARWIGKNDPGSYRARQLRAQLHESRGETDEAVREYRAALRLEPALRDVHFAIGTLLWSFSRFDEALPELQAELRINPNHAEAHYEIADILQVRGQNEEAKTHLLESIRLEPGMIESHLAIERVYFGEGRYDKALDHLAMVVALAPSDPTPHYRMSIVYRRLGKTEESQSALAEFQRLQAN